MSRRSPSEQRDPSGSKPLPGSVDEASVADDNRIDQSAGEGGRPADMSYYRVQPKAGALMLLGTIGLPVAIILLVVIVAVVVF
ncbi:hypothetical protein PANO111632_12470 [Paracoccus nototheniae]|uniref:Uncharacterized protein n=1 Tax=Paracoccus nototheniae TaxID=2489002 RepID=A0ABW4DWR5_9RHOB|nr:hypothetical protein [Paracoccus nototheniae]